MSPNSTFASLQRAIKNNLLAVKFLFFSLQLQIFTLLISSGKQEPVRNKKQRPLLVFGPSSGRTHKCPCVLPEIVLNYYLRL